MSSPRAFPDSSPPARAVSFPIPLPVDPRDVFKIGPEHMNRWFSGQVAIPQGVLGWVYEVKLLPYARRLASTLTLAGTSTDIREVGSRIVFSGVPRGRPPSRVVLPCCRPMSLRSLLAGMNKRLNSKNEGEILFWLEYLASHSDDLATELQRHPRLRDLTR